MVDQRANSQEQLNEIKSLLARREVKRADVLITRLLRSPLTGQSEIDLLLLRVEARIVTERPEDAFQDIQTLKSRFSASQRLPPILRQLEADAFLLRYEMALVGFADKGDIQAARGIYEALLQEEPDYDNTGWVNYQLGRSALMLSDVELAERYFKSALFSPSSLPDLTAYCYERLGFIAYYEKRSAEQACMFLDKAIHTYPAHAPVLWLIRVHLLKSRVLRTVQPLEALKSIDEAEKLASYARSIQRAILAEIALVRGEILSDIPGQSARTIEALQEFLQASKLPPGVDVTWSRAYEMLADAHYREGNFERAAEMYENTLRYNPDHPWENALLYRTALSHYHAGDYARALNILERVIPHWDEVGADAFSGYVLYGDVLTALSRVSSASYAYDLAMQHAPAGADITEIKQKKHAIQQVTRER